MSSTLPRLSHFAVKLQLDKVGVGIVQRINGMLGKTTTSIETAYSDATFHLETAEEIRLFLPEVAERPVVEQFTSDVTASDVVWDVGANVGLYSFLAIGKGATTVAIEPHPTNIQRLRDNAELNEGDLMIIGHALGSSEDDVMMPAGTGEPGENFGTEDVWGISDENITVSRKVGRNLIREGVESPDVVKIDVEGEELEVMQGLLPEYAPRIIYCEVHGFAHDRDGEEVTEYLQKHSYSVERIYDDFRDDKFMIKASQ